MEESITWVGIDAHAKSLHFAVRDKGGLRDWKVNNEKRAIRRIAKKLVREAAGEVRCCYEAGPTGYALKREMEPALARLRAGEDFCTVAREVSDDPSAARCGDIGFFGRGDLADELFTDAAFALPDSAVSDVIRSNYGYHIIQRLETRGDEIHVRHIVKPHEVSQDDLTRARSLVETVQQRLAEGADFVELVRAYSDRPEADGDVGYLAVDGLFPAFRQAIDGLMIGGVSDVVADEQGYHFFQLLDRTAGGAYAYAEVESQLREMMRRETVNDRYRAWLDQLRERSYVELRAGAS